MRALFLCVGVCSLSLLSGCDKPTANPASPVSSSQKWTRFVSQQCRFSVLMPGTPQSKTSLIKGETGTARSTIFTLDPKQSDDSSGYSIICAQYPHGHLQKFAPYYFLERTWKRRFDDMKSDLVYEKRIHLNGVPAIEFQYKNVKASAVFSTARYYLSQNNTYLVIITELKAAQKKGHSNDYLDSFKILQ